MATTTRHIALFEGIRRHRGGAVDGILERACAGEPSAISHLIEIYQDAVFSMAMSFTHQVDFAEDLAQEAWIKVLRGLPKFRRECSFSTWLYRIILNTFITCSKKRKRELALDLEKDLPQGEVDPRLENLASSLALQRAVRELPIEFRSVIVLRYVADLTYKEIAQVLDCPLGTVQSRLKRGMDRLTQALESKSQARG